MERETAISMARVFRPLGLFVAYWVGALWIGALAFLVLNEGGHAVACMLGMWAALALSNALITVRDKMIIEHKLTKKELDIKEDEEQPPTGDDLDGAA